MEKKKAPLSQRAQCYQIDTRSLLFISKRHIDTQPPASAPGGFSPFMQQSPFSQGFAVCLQYLCIPEYAKAWPKRHICCTRRQLSHKLPFTSQAGPHISPPEAHMPGKTKNIMLVRQSWTVGGKLTTGALPAQSTALPSSCN